MGIITTYVCDVSGVQGVVDDFVEVKIVTRGAGKSSYYDYVAMNKLVHKDVALKLHLIAVKKEEATP